MISTKQLRRLMATLVLGTACVAEAAVIQFLDGVAGYNGTTDTFIYEIASTTIYSNSEVVQVQGHSFLQGLLRFDDIIGPGAGQVAPGSTINAVTLSLVIFNPGASATVSRLL